MVVVLKHVGTDDMERDRLKMSVKTSASSEEQALKARPWMFLGPAAFRGLVLLKTLQWVGELCAASAGRIPLRWLVLRVSKQAKNCDPTDPLLETGDVLQALPHASGV